MKMNYIINKLNMLKLLLSFDRLCLDSFHINFLRNKKQVVYKIYPLENHLLDIQNLIKFIK